MKRRSLSAAEVYWIGLSAVLLGLFIGCVSQEAALPTAPVTATAAKPVAQPMNLGSVINTKLREAEPSFTADGKIMYFNCQVLPDRAGNDICVSRLVGTLENAKWTTLEVVAPGVISLNETFDVEPLISPDGKKLYFMSRDRPGGGMVSSTSGTAKTSTVYGSRPKIWGRLSIPHSQTTVSCLVRTGTKLFGLRPGRAALATTIFGHRARWTASGSLRSTSARR